MPTRPRYRRILAFDLVIALAWWLTFNAVPEPWSWVALITLHVALPVCATRWAGAPKAWRGFLIGPGLVLGIYTALLIRYVVDIWDGFPEDVWLAILLAITYAIIIGIVALYSVVVTAYLQRRALRR